MWGAVAVAGASLANNYMNQHSRNRASRNARRASEQGRNRAAYQVESRMKPIADQQLDFYNTKIQPRYEQMLDEVDDPNFVQDRVNMASGNFARSADLARQGRMMQSRRMGLSPEDINRTSRGDEVRMAAGRAGGMNRTRMAAQDTQFTRKAGLVMPMMNRPFDVANIEAQGANIFQGNAATGVQAAGVGYNAANANANESSNFWRDVAGGVGAYMGAKGGGGGGGPPNTAPYDPWAYAAGGEVDGPGTGTSDSVPAMVDGQQPAALSDGEYVIPEHVVRFYGTRHFQQLIEKAEKEGALPEPPAAPPAQPQMAPNNVVRMPPPQAMAPAPAPAPPPAQGYAMGGPVNNPNSRVLLSVA